MDRIESFAFIPHSQRGKLPTELLGWTKAALYKIVVENPPSPYGDEEDWRKSMGELLEFPEFLERAVRVGARCSSHDVTEEYHISLPASWKGEVGAALELLRFGGVCSAYEVKMEDQGIEMKKGDRP